MSQFFDAQNKLDEAFKLRDYEKFEEALLQGADPTQQYANRNMCIFEQALSTAGCSKFIDCCISKCCENTYVNHKINKAAVNFVADSADARNMETLLGQKMRRASVDYQYEGDTALNTLCRNLNSSNFKNTTECIKKLIQCGASPNIPNYQGKTPLQYVLNNELTITAEERFELIMEFLGVVKLREQDYNRGIFCLLRNYGHKMNVSDIKLYTILIRHLVKSSVELTLSTLVYYKGIFQKWNEEIFKNALLMELIDNKQEITLNLVLAVMQTSQEQENVCLMKEALRKNCNWADILVLVKDHPFTEASKLELFKNMVFLWQIRCCKSKHYEACMEFLLKGNEGEIDDLILLAVDVQNDIATLLLLRNGAKLKKGFLELVEKDILKKHFNSCITSNYVRSIDGDEEFQIDIDFSNFINSNNVLEITPIADMVEIKELGPLLKHPLIDSLLQVIWMRLRNIFYAHLAIFTALYFSLVAQILLSSKEKPTEHRVFLWICWVITAYLTINEVLTSVQLARLQIQNIQKHRLDKSMTINILKFLWASLKYITSHLDLCRILMLTLTCLEIGNQKTRNTIAVLTIILIVIKINYLFGTLPIASISKNMLMLREVANTFIKCLTQYSIFVFAFGLCFYVLFNNFDQTKPNGQVYQLNDKQNSTVDFLHPFGTLLKTFIMFFGQYEYLPEFDRFYTGWILVLFMIMAMILTNLLSALAVSDIQIVQDQAEIRAAICRTQLLHSYEYALQVDWVSWNLFQKALNALKNNSNQRYIFNGIFLRPIQNNQAYVYKPTKRGKVMKSLLQIDNDTVQEAVKIVKKKNFLVKQKLDEKIEKQFNNLSASFENQFKDMSTSFKKQFKYMTALLEKRIENISVPSQYQTNDMRD